MGGFAAGAVVSDGRDEAVWVNGSSAGQTPAVEQIERRGAGEAAAVGGVVGCALLGYRNAAEVVEIQHETHFAHCAGAFVQHVAVCIGCKWHGGRDSSRSWRSRWGGESGCGRAELAAALGVQTVDREALHAVLLLFVHLQTADYHALADACIVWEVIGFASHAVSILEYIAVIWDAACCVGAELGFWWGSSGSRGGCRTNSTLSA